MSAHEDQLRQLDSLYDRLGASAFSLACRICGPEGAARATRDAFLWVWMGSVDGGPPLDGPVEGRLFARVRELAFQYRAGERTFIAEGLDGRNGPAAEHKAVELAYFEGCDVDEIASRLRVPPSRVNRLLRQAVGRMAEAGRGESR